MSYFANNYDGVRYPIASDNKVGLRKAQLGAIHSIAAHFTLTNDPAIIVLPTGCGKTAVLMLTCFLERANRVLTITPSRLVRNQIKTDYENLTTLKRIGVLDQSIPNPKVFELESRITSQQDWEKLKDYDVVVSTPNSISPAIEGVPMPPDELFDLLLIDEAHHSPATTWNEILTVFPKTKKVLFTATPFRQDNQEIKGKILYVYPLREAYKDNVFGKISYIPVKRTEDNNDKAIAKKAEKVLMEDRSNGFNHFLIVRTDRKKRAKELQEIYKNSTKLNLELISSDQSYNFIKKTIKKLQEKELDGVICVNMLGEGFDFPNLKIAAIHAPHKSLAITLQFIGRFTRTNANDIGEAKFLAVPSDIQIETQRLYHEEAIWQEIIINLGETRINQESYIRETFENFDEPTTLAPDFEDLSLYSLKPYNHVKIYKVFDDIDITTKIQMPPSYKVVYARRSLKLSTIVFITKETRKARWTQLNSFARTEYDLFIIFFDTKTKLLFINSSRRSSEIYEFIIKHFTKGNHKPLPLNSLAKVLVNLIDFEFFNIGMRNRLIKSNSETYRTMIGTNAQKAITPTDGYLYHQGHIYGRAKEGSKSITIGYSSSSKVWSNNSSLIPDFMKWCGLISNKIDGNTNAVTNSPLDFIGCGEEISEIPEHLLGADWDVDVYLKQPTISYKKEDGSAFICSLSDLDLTIDRIASDKTKIRVILSNEDLEYHLDYSISKHPMFTVASNMREVKLLKNNNEISLIEYLNDKPLNFYSANLSRIQGTTIYKFSDNFRPFDSSLIEIVDWNKENVDIQTECGVCNNGKISIQDYLKKYLLLPAINNDIVFHDHGSGEMADFITFTEASDEITVRLYHCKGAGGSEPGERVNDVYEVCCQAVKCLIWVNDNETMFKQISYRENACINSTYLKGDNTLLKELINRGKNKHIRYEIFVVQPGISKSQLPEKIGMVLAASSDYIVKMKYGKLKVLAS